MLFFVVGVVKTCGSFAEAKRPEQAVKLSGRKNVTVIPTASMTEGYCALTMDIRDSEDVPRRIRLMREGAGSNESIAVAVATRNITRDGVSCLAGQSIVLEGDAIKAAADDPFEALSQALESAEGLDERECCVIFLGEDAPNADEERLTALFEDHNPMIEVTCIRGDQHIYRWLIGIF